MQSHHHAKSLAASGSFGSTTKSSKQATAAIGMGTASFKVVFLFLTISAWTASSAGWARSGQSIASLEVTHLTEVLKDGNTEGPHSFWSNARAYFKILSWVSGNTANCSLASQSSNLSQAEIWAAIVLGAPDDNTSCLSRAVSAADNPSLLVVSINSLENSPARFPMSSSLAAHLRLAAFSWSRSGVEVASSSGFFRIFLGGWAGFWARARIARERLALAASELKVTDKGSHIPKPSCWAVEAKKAFSIDEARLQYCSSIKLLSSKMSLIPSSSVGAHSWTLTTNSDATRTSMAEMSAKLANGEASTAWAKASEKTGRHKILDAHLSFDWAILQLFMNMTSFEK